MDNSEDSGFEQYDEIEVTDTATRKTTKQYRYTILKEEFPQEMLRAFDAI